MKKLTILFLLIFPGFNLFAFSVNDIVVPWTTGLRIRENPATSAKEIAYLGLWEKLTILEIKEGEEIIGGNKGNWVKIRRENGRVTGWCFSYFLEKIDENNFYPILEYRSFANWDNAGSEEVYTLYNDGKRRDKLVLFWNNKTIDKFENLRMSENGKIIAFNWVDPATIKRDSREGLISGNRHLFVYNFANHRLVKIDEVSMSKSDRRSKRWANEAETSSLLYPEGFKKDENLEWFILNSDGTKLFYEKNNAKIEVDLTNMNKITHQINRSLSRGDKYFGSYILLLGLRSEEDGFYLYDTVGKKILNEYKFYNTKYLVDDTYCLPEVIRSNRYLVAEQFDNISKAVVIIDLVRNQQQKFIIKTDKGGYNTNLYHENNYYSWNQSSSTVTINKFDYNNNSISQYTFNNFPSRMSSFNVHFFVHDTGIIQCQENGRSWGQAWLIICLFNNTLLEYRIDDGIYKGDYTIYIMNAIKAF